ncbi:MAG: AMIN domain-containing protein [Desulfobulbaceae bacterium]
MIRQYFNICSLLTLFLGIFFLTTAVAAPLIEKIEFDGSGANVDRITFKLNSATLPTTFALKDPPRAVFDFASTALAKGVKTNIPVTGTFIKGIRAAEHRGDKAKTRVVLDLLAAESIDFKQDFNAETHTLVISVFPLGSKPAPVVAAPEPPKAPEPVAKKIVAPAEPAHVPIPEPAATAATRETISVPEPAPAPTIAAIPGHDQGAEPSQDEATVIQPLAEIGPGQAEKGDLPPVLYSIEFDKDANKGETISFKLNTFNPPVVFGIEEDTPRIVCFFKDTTAGPELQDLLDASGRFVKSIQVGKYSNPDNIRVVLDLVPNQNYDLQQVFFKEDNMFMIIINTNN